MDGWRGAGEDCGEEADRHFRRSRSRGTAGARTDIMSHYSDGSFYNPAYHDSETLELDRR